MMSGESLGKILGGPWEQKGRPAKRIMGYCVWQWYFNCIENNLTEWSFWSQSGPVQMSFNDISGATVCEPWHSWLRLNFLAIEHHQDCCCNAKHIRIYYIFGWKLKICSKRHLRLQTCYMRLLEFITATAWLQLGPWRVMQRDTCLLVSTGWAPRIYSILIPSVNPISVKSHHVALQNAANHEKLQLCLPFEVASTWLDDKSQQSFTSFTNFWGTFSHKVNGILFVHLVNKKYITRCPQCKKKFQKELKSFK